MYIKTEYINLLESRIEVLKKDMESHVWDSAIQYIKGKIDAYKEIIDDMKNVEL